MARTARRTRFTTCRNRKFTRLGTRLKNREQVLKQAREEESARQQAITVQSRPAQAGTASQNYARESLIQQTALLNKKLRRGFVSPRGVFYWKLGENSQK
jgi:hypothetical protein